MSNLRAVIGSVIGGAIGAAVWFAIAYFANYEIGWIAWGIGLLAGLGYVAGQGVGGITGGGTAAVVSVLAILVAKAAVVQIQVHEAYSVDEFVAYLDNEYELTVSYVADEVVERYQEEGKTLDYPDGADLAYPESSKDYPEDVWAEASSQWAAMSSEDQGAFKLGVAETMSANMASAEGDVALAWFKESFGAMDILFFALAVFTAFKIGSGTRQGADAEAA